MRNFDRKQIHLCFIMYTAYPMFNQGTNETFGGSEVELFNLATYLAKFEDIKVDFIVGDYGQSEIETYNNIRLIKVKYMRLDKYKGFKHKLLRYFYLFKTLFKQPSQIYITKTASELLGWVILLQKFFKRKKVVFRLGSDKDTDMEFWRNSGKLYYLYKFGLKHCDKVYTQSKDQSRVLKDNYSIESSVLKNVFNIRSQEREVNKDYILWVSRCEPLKRPWLLIEMARNLPNENFIIIMPHAKKADVCENAFIDRIIEEVKNATLELKNLKYIEFVPFNQIQNYYNRAKLFINTSEYEGFPNSFIQACVGKTGILSMRVNPDGFLNEYNLGYCCDDRIEKAIDFIKDLSIEKVKEMGDNAYNYVIANHDISTIGNIYRNDFFELLDRRG